MFDPKDDLEAIEERLKKVEKDVSWILAITSTLSITIALALWRYRGTLELLNEIFKSLDLLLQDFISGGSFNQLIHLPKGICQISSNLFWF